MVKMDEACKLNIEEIASQLIKVQTEANDREQHLAKEALKLRESLKESEKGRIALADTIKQLEKDLDSCRTKTEVQEVMKQAINNNNTKEQGTTDATIDKPNHQACTECEILRNGMTNIIDGNNRLQALVDRKDKIIKELQDYSKFADESLTEHQQEKKELIATIKELKKRCQATTESYSSMQNELKQTTKINEEIQLQGSSSKEEIKQLLYLNSQLKQRNDSLAEKIKSHKCLTAPPVIQRPETIDSSKVDSESSQPVAENGSIGHTQDSTNEEQKLNNIKDYCYFEIRKKGSCRRGEQNCKFSHKIPSEVENNKAAILSEISSNNLCINEYRQEGSCRKKKNCRFNHNISPEQRSDPSVQEQMRRKEVKMNGGTPSSKKHICVFEYQTEGSCKNDDCRFNHDITEQQRADPILKAEAEKRMEELKQKRNTRHNNYNNYNSNHESWGNVPLPQNILEQLVMLLGNVANQNSSSCRF